MKIYKTVHALVAQHAAELREQADAEQVGMTIRARLPVITKDIWGVFTVLVQVGPRGQHTYKPESRRYRVWRALPKATPVSGR